MPRYVFTVRDAGPVPDTTEIDLPVPKEARSMALAEAGEMLRDYQDRDVWPSPEWWVHVTDAEGRTVCSLRIGGTS